MPRFESWKFFSKFNKELLDDDFNHDHRLILKAKACNLNNQDVSIKLAQKAYSLTNEFKWTGTLSSNIKHETVLNSDGSHSGEILTDLEVSCKLSLMLYSPSLA